MTFGSVRNSVELVEGVDKGSDEEEERELKRERDF